MHGDYHIGNVMFALDGPALAAIVDWELATLGDPLLDLGRLLAQWPEGDAPPPGGFRTTPHDGFPDMPEIIAHYAARTSRDMGSLRWHAVLASYKLGILLEGSNARAAAGRRRATSATRCTGRRSNAWNARRPGSRAARSHEGAKRMNNGTGRFAGKVAVVAGGASGIGLAILRGLYREGAQVVCGDVSEARLAGVAGEFDARCRHHALRRDEGGRGRGDDGAGRHRFGALDCAFNVAGASRPGYIVDLAEADWDFTVDLCLKGVFLGMKHAARHMLGRGGAS